MGTSLRTNTVTVVLEIEGMDHGTETGDVAGWVEAGLLHSRPLWKVAATVYEGDIVATDYELERRDAND